MTDDPAAWLSLGSGAAPRLGWSVAADAPLVALRFSRETGEVLAGDESGGLYLISPHGQIAAVTRGPTPLRALAISDTGQGGVALIGPTRLLWFNRQLTFQGSTELPAASLAVTVNAHGQYAAVSLEDGFTFIYDMNRKLLRKFQSQQPLVALEFLVNQQAILGIAEYGLLCCYSFQGDLLWQEKLWGQVGGLAVSGDGQSILLACYTYGIQCHAADGAQRGSYQLGGTVSKIAASFLPGRIAAATIERHFYWLKSSGVIDWQAVLPDDIIDLAAAPLGDAVICGFHSGRISRLDWSD